MNAPEMNELCVDILNFIHKYYYHCELKHIYFHFRSRIEKEPDPLKFLIDTVLTDLIVQGLIYINKHGEFNQGLLVIGEWIKLGKVNVNEKGLLEPIRCPNTKPPEDIYNDPCASVDFKSEIANYIKANPGTQNWLSLIVHFIPLMKKMNLPVNLFTSITCYLIQLGIIKFNTDNDRFEYIEEEKVITTNRAEHPFINNEKPESKTMNTEPKQPLYLISDEASATLSLIKNNFKTYMGVELTFEQTIDRAFKILKDQIDLDPFRILSVTVKKSELEKNKVPLDNAKDEAPKTHTNYNGSVHWKDSQGTDKTPKQEQQDTSEGPYAHLYPGFRNMILQQREKSLMNDIRDIANCINSSLSNQEAVTTQKKKRKYQFKTPKK